MREDPNAIYLQQFIWRCFFTHENKSLVKICWFTVFLLKIFEQLIFPSLYIIGIQIISILVNVLLNMLFNQHLESGNYKIFVL